MLHLHRQEELGDDVHLQRRDQAISILKNQDQDRAVSILYPVSSWMYLALFSPPEHLVKSPEGRRENKVIDVRDTGDGDTGDDAQELP